MISFLRLVNLTVDFFMSVINNTKMTYLTSWDINVYLCLLTIFPEDIVSGMMKMVKETNRTFCLERDREWHCIRMSIVFLVNCHIPVITEYKERLRVIEPEDRYDYFEWGYINHYDDWTEDTLEWVKGFHPGRFYLMDLRRIRQYEIESFENIRDLEDIGANFEKRFIQKQSHIEDLLKKE